MKTNSDSSHKDQPICQSEKTEIATNVTFFKSRVHIAKHWKFCSHFQAKKIPIILGKACLPREGTNMDRKLLHNQLTV
jgi:hypothetical protein